jgi:hypothetical protein
VDTEIGTFIDDLVSAGGGDPLAVGTIATQADAGGRFTGIERGALGWSQLTRGDVSRRFGSDTDARAIHREIVRQGRTPTREGRR